MPFLLSAFWPSQEMAPGTMPSADFCTLTASVSRDGAIGFHQEIAVWFVFPDKRTHIR